MADVQKNNNIVGEKSFFSGRFFVNGTIVINGKFEGPFIKVDQIHVGKYGKVTSKIIASSVVVEGIVVGDIEAAIRIMLLPTARVLGDIRTPELIIQNGVVLEGKCVISSTVEHSVRDQIMSEYNRED